MRYFVGGINCVGKSHFLNKLKELKPEYETVDGSRAFMKWLGFNDDYEKLRDLTPTIREARLSEFISQVINKSEAETLVYAGHFLVLIRGEILQVTRDWVSRFDGAILMKAKPEIIYERIIQDERDRALFKENTSREEALKILHDFSLKENVSFLEMVQSHGLPSVLIDNNEANELRVVDQFLEFDAKIRRSYL